MWKLLLILLVAVALPASHGGKPPKKGKNDVACNCLDICINIDTSGSIDDTEWAQVIAFICGFLGSFTNPPDDVRFCAIEFSRVANPVFDFTDSCNGNPTFAACKAIIQGINRQQGSTNHEAALQLALTFFPSDGDRPDDECPDVMILITDGRTTSGGDPVPVANTLTNDREVTIFVIGIGNGLDIGVLEAIAGNPDRVFLTDFDRLPDIVNDLRTSVCDTDDFDPDCQTCCCGELFGDHHKPFPDRKSKCCGKIRYDPKKTKAVCCQGKFFPGYDERCTRCCYDKPYDIRYYTCCYNRIVPATRTQDQCCGFTAYNQKHQICCNYRLFRKKKKVPTATLR